MPKNPLISEPIQLSRSWNHKGSYFLNPETQLPKLHFWNPNFFTDPKQCKSMFFEPLAPACPLSDKSIVAKYAQWRLLFEHPIKSERSVRTNVPFKFIVHTALTDYLLNRENLCPETAGIFSKHEYAEEMIKSWDVIATSLISNEKPICYHSFGAILEVPMQNILVTYHEDIGSELGIGRLDRIKHLVRAANRKKFTETYLKEMPLYERSGLLFKEISEMHLHCSDEILQTPDEILNKTLPGIHNEIIIVTKPHIHVHPGFPPTREVKIMGYFFMDHFPNQTPFQERAVLRGIDHLKFDWSILDKESNARSDIITNAAYDNILLSGILQSGLPVLYIKGQITCDKFLKL